MRAHPGKGPLHGLPFHPGRLRHGLRVLRHGPSRLSSQHDARRDARTGARRPAVPAGQGRAAAFAQPRVHGHGRAALKL